MAVGVEPAGSGRWGQDLGIYSQRFKVIEQVWGGEWQEPTYVLKGSLWLFRSIRFRPYFEGRTNKIFWSVGLRQGREESRMTLSRFVVVWFHLSHWKNGVAFTWAGKADPNRFYGANQEFSSGHVAIEIWYISCPGSLMGIKISYLSICKFSKISLFH